MPSLADGILYIVADPINSHNQIATIVGSVDLPSYVVVNELTTVATAYTMNQFLDETIIGGNSVGVRNSASTFRNLVDQATQGTLQAKDPRIEAEKKQLFYL